MKNRDLFPNETQNGFIRSDGRKAEVFIIAILGGDGDAEKPRDIADGIFELGRDFFEGGSVDNGEHTFHYTIGTTFHDEGEGLVENLLGVVDDAAGGTLVKLVAGAGGLAEEDGEFFGFGFEFDAFLLEGLGAIGVFGHLVGQLDGPCQDLLDNAGHGRNGGPIVRRKIPLFFFFFFFRGELEKIRHDSRNSGLRGDTEARGGPPLISALLCSNFFFYVF